MAFPILTTFIVLTILVFTLMVFNGDRRAVRQRSKQGGHSLEEALCDCKLESLCTSVSNGNSKEAQMCGYEGRQSKICCPLVHQGHVDQAPVVEHQLENSTPGPEEITTMTPVKRTEATKMAEESDFTYLAVERNESSLESFDFDYETESPRPVSPKFNIGLGENQVSFKAHENFKLLPSWKQCGVHESYDKNQKEVVFDEHPWVVQIAYKLEGGEMQYKCTGTLISEKWVLAPAHCNAHGVPSEILVRAPNGPTSKFTTIALERFVQHWKYDAETMENDITLHRLSERKNKTVGLGLTPACLPFSNEYAFAKEDLFVSPKLVGFSTEAIINSFTATEVIEQFPLTLLTDDKCKPDADEKTQSSYTQFCAEISKSSTTSCESSEIDGSVYSRIAEPNAAPKYIHVGIASHPPNCLVSPGRFTRVSSYLQWIIDSIEP